MKKRLTLTLNPELSKNLVKTKTDCLVLGVNDGGALNTFASDIDKATNGIIGKLRKRGEFEAKVGQTAYIATNDGTITTLPPYNKAPYISQTLKSKQWLWNIVQTSFSLNLNWNASLKKRRTILPCSTITPLGLPVVPEV